MICGHDVEGSLDEARVGVGLMRRDFPEQRWELVELTVVRT